MESTTQIYLELTFESGKLEGEARAGGYESRIDIDGFQFSASADKQALKDLEKGDVTANVNFGRLSLSKVFDRSSLLLAGALNRHEKFTEAKIAVDQQYIDAPLDGKIRNEVLILYLYSGYIADIKLRTSEGNVGASIKEDITLSFLKCTVYYYAYAGEKGKLGDDYRQDVCMFEAQRKAQDAE